MSEQTKKTLVPKLRFPEFRNVGEWEQRKLKTLAKRITQKNKESTITRVLTNSAADGIVDQRDYFDKDIANKNNLGGYFIVDKGDYVYNPRISNTAPVGPISKNRIGKGVMSPLYTVFRFKNSNNDFYAQYFKSTHWYQYLRMVSNSGARHDRMSIINDDFEKMPLPAPSSKEQQKIADCLSSIDELITAHSQKHDALKAHKKGLMQQLFPAEGKAIPKLRFPEFRNSGEWESSQLSNFVVALDAGVSVNSGDRPAQISEAGILKTSAVTNGIFEPTENKVVYEESEIQRLKESVCEGTIIISRMNTPALVGANAYVKASFKKLFLPDRLWAAKPKPDTSIRFIAFMLGSGKTRVALSELATGTSGSMKNITKLDVLALQISAPSLLEQQKIADCLSFIDDLITTQAQKIELLKAHKKGLMQQLFPSVDEVNGSFPRSRVGTHTELK